MTFVYIVLFSILQFHITDIEGEWKLKDYSGFLIMLENDVFKNLPEDRKLEVLKGWEFVRNNTFYSFKGDSVNFTNPSPNYSITEKKGRFLMKSDTLIIFESGKVNAIKFFITSLKEDELKLTFVRDGGEIGPTEMTFERVK
ncbi:MAG: hypothetical protein ACI9UV_002745 [Algoriphagus sp.]|jgi:hypothetical protein